jgi:DNA-directed RNA polymerase specialized sigma24 family protein
MSPENSGSARRDLTAEMLQRLLDRLGDTPREAGERYNNTRARLIQFFRWQRVGPGEDLADEVLNRVARRLAEGEQIPNIHGYTAGVARLVALEARQRAVRERHALEGYAHQVSEDTSDEHAIACLDQCLGGLSPERREHLLAYYSGDRKARILQRSRLAERLGVGPVALRNRMLRMRQQLETCLERCLSVQSARDDSGAANTSGTGKPGRQPRKDGS